MKLQLMVACLCLGLTPCFLVSEPVNGAPEKGNPLIQPVIPYETERGGLVFPRNTFQRGTRPQRLVEHRLVRSQPDAYSIFAVNPPTFRWQQKPGRANRYEIEISQDPDFRNSQKVTVENAFYRPMLPLASGQWWWRTRPAGGSWTKSVTFTLPENLVEWPIPSWKVLMSRIPRQHPRIYLRPEEVALYRDKAGGSLESFVTEWSDSMQESNVTMGRDERRKLRLTLLDSKASDAEDAHQYKDARRYKKWAAKSKARTLTGRLPDISWLWMMTGDRKWAEQAKKMVLKLVDLETDGETSAKKSDFANTTIMSRAAIAYDMLYDEFTDTERARIREMLVARARPVMKTFLTAVPMKLFSAHGWQKTYLDGMIVALALYGEEAEATQWLEQGLKRFVAFYPWFGGADGGSTEGANYFTSSDLPGSFRVRDFFYSAFDIDFARSHPWYKNRLYYLIYSFPPNGIMSTFGDVNPRRSREVPSFGAAVSARRMAITQDNGFAAEYAANTMAKNKRGSYLGAVRWLPAREVKRQPLKDLPRAKLFSDIGIAYLYSDITDANENVRFEFRSSPFGSASHAHADQNSFNIIAGNQPLIIDSGYYNAYGTDHHKNWTTQTKAHNTILVDGKGQGDGRRRNTAAYGQILQFLDGEKFAYLLGEAETAYSRKDLTRFDRHVVWLKGGRQQTYVIIDDLESSGDGDRPRQFDWLLHASEKMELDQKNGVVTVYNEKAQARVTFISPGKLKFSQTDKFSTPAKKLRTSSVPLSPQWHLTASVRAQGAASFITVIQVGDKNAEFPAISRSGEGFLVDGWSVILKPDLAEFNPP